MSLVFDHNHCLSCGKCVADCVCGILSMKGEFPSFKEGKSELCVHCGHCVSVCPVHAVSLDGMDPALLQTADEISSPEKQLDALLKCRRSIRQYTGVSLEQRVLERALEYASYAPTAHNFRQVSYIVINGRAKVEVLLKNTALHMERHGMYPGQVANVKSGQDTLFRGAPCLILIHAPERLLSESDCATAASYLELALHALGMGSCWAGMLVEACAYGLPEGIALPEGHKLYGSLMAGKPALSYKRIPFRKAPEITWL